MKLRAILPTLYQTNHQQRLFKFTLKHILIGGFIVLLGLVALFLNDPFYVGADLWPIYVAAKLAWRGHTPYGEEATRLIAQEWISWSSDAGIAYPLPYLLLTAPLTVIPYMIILPLWLTAIMTLGYQVIKLNPDSQTIIYLPLCYSPFMSSVYIVQTTLLIFGLMVLIVLGIQANRSRLVAIILPFLMIKPQMSIFYVGYGIWWLWQNHRRDLVWFTGVGILLLGMSFAFQPNWIPEMIKQAVVYNRVVEPQMLLPLGLLIIAAVWRSPWWVFGAVLPLMIFPLSDFYSTLPLLFFWVYVGGWQAYAGAVCSWGWNLPNTPMSVALIWVFVFIPVLTYVLLDWQRKRQHRIVTH